MARDDDIFRKLKKETPLIKRKDLQPLTSRDFSKKSSFDMQIEQQSKKTRVTPRHASADDLSPFSREPKRIQQPERRRSAVRPAPRAKQRDVDVFGDNEREKPSRSYAEPTIREEPRQKPQPQQKHERMVSRPEPRNQARQKPQQRHERMVSRPEPRISIEKPKHAAQELEVFQSRRTNMHRHSLQTQSFAGPDISADMLDQTANGVLTFRHELKYYINYRDYILLRNTLKTLLALDRYSGESGDYHIRSLYFDDVYDTALHEKVAGHDVRNKYRIRIYNFNDNVIRFEKKMKRGQFIAKQSIRLSREECDALLQGDCSVLEGRKEPLASEIYLQMKNNRLRPRVIVDYRREAYISSVESVRITFDKDLKGGLWLTDIFNDKAPTMPVFDSGLMVLEVKFNKYLPIPIKAVLNNINAAHRCAISKYVLCRWHH